MIVTDHECAYLTHSFEDFLFYHHRQALNLKQSTRRYLYFKKFLKAFKIDADDYQNYQEFRHQYGSLEQFTGRFADGSRYQSYESWYEEQYGTATTGWNPVGGMVW